MKFPLQVQDYDATSNNSWDNGNPGAGVSLVFVNMNVKVVVCDCGKTYQMSPELARKFYERGKKDPILPELTHQNDKILTCPKLKHYQQRYWISLISRKTYFLSDRSKICNQNKNCSWLCKKVVYSIKSCLILLCFVFKNPPTKSKGRIWNLDWFF